MHASASKKKHNFGVQCNLEKPAPLPRALSSEDRGLTITRSQCQNHLIHASEGLPLSFQCHCSSGG